MRYFIFFLILVPFVSFAQNRSDSTIAIINYTPFALYENDYQPDTIISAGFLHYSEEMPQPSVDVKDFFSKHLHYPKDAVETEAEGRIMIKFIVTEKGYLDSIMVLRGLLPSMNEEALRLVKLLPQPWKPGKNLQHQPARFWYVMPVTFKLE